MRPRVISRPMCMTKARNSWSSKASSRMSMAIFRPAAARGTPGCGKWGPGGLGGLGQGRPSEIRGLRHLGDRVVPHMAVEIDECGHGSGLAHGLGDIGAGKSSYGVHGLPAREDQE